MAGRIAAALFALVAAGGCDRAPRRATTPAPTPAPAARAPAPAHALPLGFDRLVAAIAEVGAVDDAFDHQAVAAALRLLAEVIGATDPAAGLVIGAIAEELGRLPRDAPAQGELVDRALDRALVAISRALPRPVPPALRDAYARAMLASDALRPREPLARQVSRVEAALATLANAIAALYGADPVAPVRDDIAPRHDPVQLAQLAERASALVGELARIQGWEASGAHAARVLDALADVVEVAPIGGSQADWASLVLAVRYGALRLARAGPDSLERSDELKAGLIAVASALGRIERVEPQAVALVATARRAVDGIEDRTIFVFQRAAIQEALRAIADAFLVIAAVPSGGPENSWAPGA